MKPETALIMLFKIHWRLFDMVSKDRKKYVYSTFIYEYSKLETIVDLIDKIMPYQIDAKPLRIGLNRRYAEYLRKDRDHA